MGFKQGVCVAALSTALTSAATVGAAVTYEAPDSCPSERQLVEAIGSRLADDGSVTPDFRLVIEPSEDPAFFLGELEMEGEFRRSLSAPSCADVIDGAAVIIALRVAEREAEAKRARDEALAPPSVPAAASPVVMSAAEPPPATPPTRLERHHDAARGPGYSFSAGGGVWGGAAPAPIWGPVIALGLHARGQRPWSLRLGAERAASGTVQTQPAAIWTRLTTGSLSACVFVLGRAPRLEICLQSRAGVFDAGGIAESPIVRAQQISRPWIALGPALRAELGLARHLRLAWELATPIPLTRQRLTFDQPDVLVYSAPPVGGGLQVSLEWGSDAEPERSKAPPLGMAH